MAATRTHEPHEHRRVRVVVAAADPRRRSALRDALTGERAAVVAVARDAHETLELTRWYRPDALLVELGLPASGAPIAELAPLVRGVVVLAPDRDDVAAGLTALRAGARAFVELPGDPLEPAVRAAAAGEATISPRLAMAVLDEVRELLAERGMRPIRSALTPREWEVLDLLAGGASTAEIAAALQVTHHTVYGHVKRILRKLGVASRADAVRAAAALRHPRG